MSDEDQEINEYVDLPDDPEMAFAILQERKNADLQRILAQEENTGWYHERKYIDILVAFDEVYNLGIYDTFKSRLRVGFESHAARANLRTRSMTEAA